MGGGGSNGGGFPIWTCPSFFVVFCPFWDFPDFSGICSGMVWGFSQFVPFSFSAYQAHLRGTVPKGSATQSGPFPKKVGNPPDWKPPGLASLNSCDFQTPFQRLRGDFAGDLQFHRVLQGPAQRRGAISLHVCGSPDPFSCSKKSLFCLKTCTPMN